MNDLLRARKIAVAKGAPTFYGLRDPQTSEEWDALAKYLGEPSGQVLKEMTELTDSIINEIIEEENQK